MKIVKYIMIILLFWGCGGSDSSKGEDIKNVQGEESMENIRKPAVSGMWYPSDRNELEEYLDTLKKFGIEYDERYLFEFFD